MRETGRQHSAEQIRGSKDDYDEVRSVGGMLVVNAILMKKEKTE